MSIFTRAETDAAESDNEALRRYQDAAQAIVRNDLVELDRALERMPSPAWCPPHGRTLLMVAGYFDRPLAERTLTGRRCAQPQRDADGYALADYRRGKALEETHPIRVAMETLERETLMHRVAATRLSGADRESLYAAEERHTRRNRGL